jgi:chemotaxis protein CheD
MAEDVIKVNMGELKIGRGGDVLAAYGVGSCVIVACYDRGLQLAAMLHGILPEKPGGRRQYSENKYLNTGIDNLVKSLLKEGISLKNMEAKIFGGAKMFDISNGQETIGERNIRTAKETLSAKGIPVIAEDTGSNYGRSIEFYVTDKKAVIKSFAAGTKEL